MKAIILAAGYATRLYPLTLNTPKMLLEIAGRTMMDYIMDDISTIDDIDEVFVITNHKFYNTFIEWTNSREFIKPVKILDDNTTSDEDKLGA
jgi:glucose-1-phosphate thymidylyltransferase